MLTLTSRTVIAFAVDNANVRFLKTAVQSHKICHRNYAGVNSFGEDRDDLSLHPTVKPVTMVADAIRDCSHRKGIVAKVG